jgi:hypothetical protein
MPVCRYSGGYLVEPRQRVPGIEKKDALLTLDLSLQLQRYPRASDQRGAETSKRMPRSQRKVVQDRI